MNPGVDHYLAEGCGRCPLGSTPDCKVHPWQEILTELRKIVLTSELTEEIKWGVPCYTVEGKNIFLLSAFKNYAAISFFKGALLKDPHHVLEKPGANSQASRVFKFTSLTQLEGLEKVVKTYIEEAIKIEKAGLAVPYKKAGDFEIPEELQLKFEEDPDFKAAFEALTPGRQRGYVLHFSQAKQSKTRTTRIEKWKPRIFEGKGMHDR